MNRHLAKFLLPGCYRWIVELKAVLAPSWWKIGRQDPWSNGFFQAVDTVFIIFPGVKLKFRWILIVIIIIVVSKLNDGIPREAIIKALEKISSAQDLWVVGYHCRCFTKRSTSAGLESCSFCKVLWWQGHLPQVHAHSFVHVCVQPQLDEPPGSS